MFYENVIVSGTTWHGLLCKTYVTSMHDSYVMFEAAYTGNKTNYLIALVNITLSRKARAYVKNRL